MRQANPKLRNVETIAKFLQHSIWHCKFGSTSDGSIRIAEPSDIEAANILELYRKDFTL